MLQRYAGHCCVECMGPCNLLLLWNADWKK